MTHQTVAAFDFDGTITTKDTFVPFICQTFGYGRVLRAFAQHAPRALLAGRGISNRDRLKELLVRSLFSGESVERLSVVGQLYATTLGPLLRATALQRIAWHKAEGHRCIMVSASLDIYLREVANTLKFDDLLCSVLSHDNQVFDGALRGGNCRRKEKVNRLQSLLGDLSAHTIYAYGDSTGDKEMLARADYGYYRPFESGKPALPLAIHE